MLKSSWSSYKILFRNVSLCKVSAWFFFPLKGVSARLIKVAPACAVMISTYEYSKSFFRQYNMEKATSATVTKMFWFRGSSEVNTEVNIRRYLRQCSAIVLLAESVEMEAGGHFWHRYLVSAWKKRTSTFNQVMEWINLT